MYKRVRRRPRARATSACSRAMATNLVGAICCQRSSADGGAAIMLPGGTGATPHWMELGAAQRQTAAQCARAVEGPDLSPPAINQVDLGRTRLIRRPGESKAWTSRRRSSHSPAKFASYTPPPADSSQPRYHNLPISIQDQDIGAAELHPDGNRGSRGLHCRRPPELDPAVDLLPPANVCANQQLKSFYDSAT
uniref:Uncharacterized protein n=1 Tax=Setaria italica TaxID=4555 RepID=K3XM96_SETIT